MNIFILHNDPDKCVLEYPNAHVNKMITESVQMLSFNLRLAGHDVGYKFNKAHANHPCTKWVRESLSNTLWLEQLIRAMHKEWQYRFNHPEHEIHKAMEVFYTLPVLDIPDQGLTPFVQCMPEEYRGPDTIEAYRRFYIGDKWHIRKYTGRPIPAWYTK